MSKPSRTRRILKWAGAVVSVLILIVWLDSIVNSHWIMITTPWLVRWNNEIVSLDRGAVEIAAERPGDLIRVHLALPFLLVAIPTALLFWCDRRRRIPQGHCQSCGYNLFSNTSGICPECGTPIPKETREKLKAETQA